ncbi:MAG: hypothetical protein IJW12_01930 [Opitutales bacterium]|nr:hypothetical protein [Opitutales bacterium]
MEVQFCILGIQNKLKIVFHSEINGNNPQLLCSVFTATLAYPVNQLYPFFRGQGAREKDVRFVQQKKTSYGFTFVDSKTRVSLTKRV